jgi:hypothetical protein
MKKLVRQRGISMSRIDKSRITAAAGAFFLVGGMGLMAVSFATSASAHGGAKGGLQAHPAMHLKNGEVINVGGKNQTPGDKIVLEQCLRGAADPSGCDPATATQPITVSAKGVVPLSPVTVATGNIGTGTCGTSKSDARSCEIAGHDVTTGTLFVAFANIAFGKVAATTTTLPATTVPTTSIPITIP